METQDGGAIPMRLLRLTSALLPVGAFAYSRGLEHAVHAGAVTDEASVRHWVFGTLAHSFAPLDGALFLRMVTALKDGNSARFIELDATLTAARESEELLLEDQRMAASLLTLLQEMGVAGARDPALACKSYPAVYALAVHDMEITAEAGLLGLMWSTCEAQVGAAMRLGIMGQTAGQRILADAAEQIAPLVRLAADRPEDEIGNLSFMVAVHSALHEDQYSRLFRS